MNYNLILASSSPRRRMLLENYGIKFEIISPDVSEEIFENEKPGDFVKRIAVEKATSVAGNLTDENVIIAADTAVVIDEKVLGKPSDEKDAYRMLKLLSGKTHNVMTGFCVVKSPDKILHTEICVTGVIIKNLDPYEIRGYIRTGEPMDKAGAYAIQGIGAFMVKEINGSYTNVVGLPLFELFKALSDLSIMEIYK